MKFNQFLTYLIFARLLMVSGINDFTILAYGKSYNIDG
jgi:hypothetical protein